MFNVEKYLIPGNRSKPIAPLKSQQSKTHIYIFKTQNFLPGRKIASRNSTYIQPIRHGGLLGLKWIFTVNKPLLEFNFTSLYSILCSSLRDISDDCRQVAVSIVLPIAEFICHDHLFRGIEIAQLAWALIKGLSYLRI